VHGSSVRLRVEQGAIDRVLRQHRAHDHLLRGDHGLAVVPGHVAFLLRITRTSGSVMFARGPVPAPFPGCCGLFPGMLSGSLRVPACLVLSREPVLGPGQPLPPPGPAGSARGVADCPADGYERNDGPQARWLRIHRPHFSIQARRLAAEPL